MMCCRPRILKYLQLCGPAASSQSAVIDYIQRFFPSNLRDLLLVSHFTALSAGQTHCPAGVPNTAVVHQATENETENYW